MIQTADGEVVITNDGATILKHMSVMHPAARMVRSFTHPPWLFSSFYPLLAFLLIRPLSIHLTNAFSFFPSCSSSISPPHKISKQETVRHPSLFLQELCLVQPRNYSVKVFIQQSSLNLSRALRRK